MSAPTEPPSVFANPDVVPRAWYVAGRSRDVLAGESETRDMLGRRIVVFRDESGQAHALDARCPHLGADLGEGTVQGQTIRCALHGWRFGTDGSCSFAPGFEEPPPRSVRRYPVTERWGLIWLFNGPDATFGLPPLPDATPGRWRVVRLRPQTLACHPHLVIGNGLDTGRVDSLLDMELRAEPDVRQVDALTVQASIRVRPRGPWLRGLVGAATKDVEATFRGTAGSLAWATFEAPVHFHVLFTGCPTGDGACSTHTVVFLKSWSPLYMMRAALLTWALLRDDRRILDTLDFRRAFTDQDEAIRLWAETVDAMETW